MQLIQQSRKPACVLALASPLLFALGCSATGSKPQSLVSGSQFTARSDAAVVSEQAGSIAASPKLGDQLQELGENIQLCTSGLMPQPENVASTNQNDLRQPTVEFASNVTWDETNQQVESIEQPELTLEVLEQLALRHNPALLQASAAEGQARGIYQQVGLKPNPTVGYFGQEIGNEGAGGQHGGYFSQTWIRGGKLAWNRSVIAHDVTALHWRRHVQQQRILTDLRIVFCDALAAQFRLQLARDFRQVVVEAVELANISLDAKVGTRPDLLQTEIQLSEIDLVIQQAEIDLSAAGQQLAALCGVAGFGEQIIGGDFAEVGKGLATGSLDQDELLAELFASSPELAWAQTQVDRACANLNRQRRQAIPNVTTQVGVASDDATGDAFTNLQVSLPIPVHNQNQGNVRAAAAAYEGALQNAERIRSRLRSDLAKSMREYRKADAAVSNLREQILPRTNAALELIQEGKEAGEFDFLRVLTARRMYFDSNLQFVAAQAKLAQARAEIAGNLLTGGLSQNVTYSGSDSLRGQALSGQ